MLTAARPRAAGKRVLSGAALALLVVGTAPSASHARPSVRRAQSRRLFFFRSNPRKPRIWARESCWWRAGSLADPNFAETVVLLVRYDAEGVVGLILNRRSHVPLSRVLEGLKAAKGRSDPVYLGGPVETPAVFALFQSPAKLEGAEHIFGGVYLISTKPLFEQTISARPDPGVFHVYLGYAGWTNDQLRKEVELGAWFIFPADAGAVFDSDPDSLWSQMIRKTELKLAGSEPADADQWPLLWSSERSFLTLISSKRAASHREDNQALWSNLESAAITGSF